MPSALTRALYASFAALPLLAFAARASAADEAPVPAPTAAPAPAPAPAPKAAAAAAKEEPDDGSTDHSKVIGKIGIGYFGQFDVPYGALGTGAPGNPGTAPTQMVGVRYWFQEKMGLDLGLGLGISSGSTERPGAAGTTVKSDTPSIFAFSLKAGVPLALGVGRHYAFILEPQVLFGHASETIKAAIPPSAPGTVDTTHSGNHFQIGASAGAIVYFGFIGIPQLTLDATVGLYADIANGTTNSPVGAAPTTSEKRTFSSFVITTQTAHQPWNIFNSNVAAIYHF
jgi:hypothetical protein